MFKGLRRKIRIYKYNNPYSHRLFFATAEAAMTLVELALLAAVCVGAYALFLRA